MSISSSHHPLSSHQASTASRHQPSRRHIKGTRTTPPPLSRRHLIMGQAASAHVVSYRSRSRPRRHPIRSSRAEWAAEARQEATEPLHIKIMATPTPNTTGNDIMMQASSPVRSPSPDTKSGERNETMRSGQGKAKRGRRKTSQRGKQATQPRPMTSSERTRHEQRGNRTERWKEKRNRWHRPPDNQVRNRSTAA